MDEISLTIFIGRRAECFRQKEVASKKKGETGHIRSREHGLNAECQLPPLCNSCSHR